MENIVTSVPVKTTWQEIWWVFVSFTQSAAVWLGGYKIKALGAAWLCVEIHKYKLNYKKFNKNTNVQSDSAAGWLGGYEIKAISAVQLCVGIR